MSEYKRLTARSQKNNMAYLVGVNDNEQGLEGSYNTLICVREAFERLADYENTGLSPEQVLVYADALVEGRLQLLPLKPGSEEFVTIKGEKYYRADLLGYGVYGPDPNYKSYCVRVHREDGYSFVDWFKQIYSAEGVVLGGGDAGA